MTGFSPFTQSACAGSGESVDWKGLAWTSIGTFAASACANTLNQIYEIKTDARMRRTMMRPLPLGRVSRLQALGFAGLTGVAGIAILAQQVNSLPVHPSHTTHSLTDSLTHSPTHPSIHLWLCLVVHGDFMHAPLQVMRLNRL